jgi:hypothetical protein
MESASRTDESWSMLSVGVLPRAGSPAVSVVVSEVVDTPRPCPPGPWAQDLTHLLDLVALAVDGEEALVVEEAVEAVAIDLVDLVEGSATKEDATASADRHPRTHLLGQAVDVVGLEAEALVETDSIVVVIVVVTVAVTVVVTVVLPAATANPFAPGIATRTVTAATTEEETDAMTGMATASVTAVMIAGETVGETASEATVTVTGMAAERTMVTSDVARMKLASMTRAPADVTKYSSHGYSPSLFSASFCWWVSLCLSRVPFSRVRG